MQQRKLQGVLESDTGTYTNLVERQRVQEADVIRLRERDEVKEKVRLLETFRPIPLFKAARDKHREARERRAKAVEELAELENEVEPRIRAIKEKEKYQAELRNARSGRVQAVDQAAHGLEQCNKDIQTIKDKLSGLDKETDAEKRAGKGYKAEYTRLDGVITGIQRRLDEGEPAFDAAALNEAMVSSPSSSVPLQHILTMNSVIGIAGSKRSRTSPENCSERHSNCNKPEQRIQNRSKALAGTLQV